MGLSLLSETSTPFKGPPAVKKLYLLCVPVLFLTSCATILAPGPDIVAVNSSPEGARVKLDGQPVGKTPLVVSFDRKGEGVLTFNLSGYEPMVIDRDKVVNGWVFGNIIFGGIIGLIVDFVTHNQGLYSTQPIFVELVPLRSPSSSS